MIMDVELTNMYHYYVKRTGQLSRYSDWLRATGFDPRTVQSGDLIPVEAKFFAHIQTGPGAQPASGTMGTGSFPGG
jgi:hypothetical protein